MIRAQTWKEVRDIKGLKSKRVMVVRDFKGGQRRSGVIDVERIIDVQGSHSEGGQRY